MGTGDIYSDLLKIAETAIEEYPKALFKGKVVEVIQQGPATGLSRIREEGREFSTKTVNLKPYGMNTVAPRPDTQPVQITPGMQSLETYVESVGCTIWVEAQPFQVAHVIAQYEADVQRAITPEEEKYVKPHGRQMTTFPPEWRAEFIAPPPNVQSDFPHDTVGGKWRVNFKDFVRYLISRGFTLGVNQQKA